VAHQHEQGREAFHALLEQGLDRLRRHVATGEAGTAGRDDHVYRGIGDPLLYPRANRINVIGNDGPLGHRVTSLPDALDQGRTGFVIRELASI
jgi:hypothetical protein